jgi:oxygen-independent coproporphyrinogen-3 oxidase
MNLLHLLKKWDRPVPRYTSYPPATEFGLLDEAAAKQKWNQLKGPLSVYVHIPFCKTMCLYCGCSVILNRRPEKQAEYVKALLQEAKQIALPISELHLGGGTPTELTEEQLEQIRIALPGGQEVSIEIDPRTVIEDRGRKLRVLKNLGFTRVSFGVQDLDPRVQEAVRRRQGEEVTRATYEWARELGFEGINVDLIYGLPLQTIESFRRTADEIAKMRPDRIALFSYAKVPWLKKHQLAIREKDLPSPEVKLELYMNARATFLQAGYVQIGMDHFAWPTDSLSVAYREKRLQRNFQGYSVKRAENQVGLGVTSIGCYEGMYAQNVKDLPAYYERIEQGKMAVFRGKILSEEEKKIKSRIEEMMCNFETEAGWEDWSDMEELVEKRGKRIVATEMGRLFVRVIASKMDPTYQLKEERYSRSV